jgi:hypothetical protein
MILDDGHPKVYLLQFLDVQKSQNNSIHHFTFIENSFYSIRYTLASEMEDINMGDTHLITLNDCGVDDDEPSCDHYMALIVAQHRNNFDFTALDSGKF